MRLDSDKAFRFFMEHGVLATMRMNRRMKCLETKRFALCPRLYVPGMIVWITRNGKRVARAVVLDVLPNTEENRRRLVHISGFSSVEEWVEEARRLHRGRLPNSIVVIARL